MVPVATAVVLLAFAYPLISPDSRAMHLVTIHEPFEAPGGERERTRLELVGLAAEIAAVAGHAKSTLLPEGLSAKADVVRQRCRFFLRSAQMVLSPEACLDHLSTQDLRKAVASFRALQRKLACLREEEPQLRHDARSIRRRTRAEPSTLAWASCPAT
jgi:hypothetical protein